MIFLSLSTRAGGRVRRTCTAAARQTVLLLIAVGCVCCVEQSGSGRSTRPRPGETAHCSSFENDAPLQTLAELMAHGVNARMSRISLLLFHEQHDQHGQPSADLRNEEVAQLAQSLADCFVVARQMYKGPPSDCADFAGLAEMQSFNARSL